MKKDDTVPQELKFKEMFDMTLESDHDHFAPYFMYFATLNPSVWI
jgi:hypothetical protein